jgi:S-adenosylmethionine/arginine decarboxylase-like enzyme
MEPMSFGYSYLLDMYHVKEGAADDLELHYRFLEELVERIGMTPMSSPVVMHGPMIRGVEMYPDKAGVSGWAPLIESGIQIHSLEPTHFITLDVYSCRKFEPWMVKDFARQTFGFMGYEEHFIERGTRYVDH